MQRVRIGLTGLAFVFVLVLVAAVFSNAAEEAPITANGLERLAANSAGLAPGDEPEPKEPLAKLGVAPGNADNVSDPAQPKPAP
jgi:hypothetical protein